MEQRQVQIAKNESLFRRINESIESEGNRFDESIQVEGHVLGADSALEYVCECGDDNCNQLVRMTREDYSHVRQNPTHFLVLPGHEEPDAEVVVEDHGTYRVVEKVGEAKAIVLEEDPNA